MRPWIRRLQAALGMGVIWGVAWSAVGTIPRWVLGFNADAPFPLVFGVLGFFAGVTFSGLVMLVERRRRFDQISLPRFAVWGAAGGVALSSVFAKVVSFGLGDALIVIPAIALASSVCAVGSLAIARRARRSALLPASEDADTVELREHRPRKLL